METIEKNQLSAELQELYLDNKQWLSDIVFLEDETRFFQKLFDNVIPFGIDENNIQEFQFVNISLNHLKRRREELKVLIINHQSLLEVLLKDIDRSIGLEFLETNNFIIKEIKGLFVEEKFVRKELYVLVEQIMDKQKKSHLLAS